MTRFQSFGKFKKDLKKNTIWKKLTSSNFNIVIIALIIVISVLYLAQINNVAAKGFKIKELETKADELKEKNDKLELRIAELKSLSRIEGKVDDLQMVSIAGNVDYISDSATAVALNK